MRFPYKWVWPTVAVLVYLAIMAVLVFAILPVFMAEPRLTVLGIYAAAIGLLVALAWFVTELVIWLRRRLNRLRNR